MEAPSLTLAVPFYANLDYLQRTLKSIQAQTNRNWRCIVVDDCGPEPGAEQLVQSLNDSRFTYQRFPQNIGLAGNWNRCFDSATTELITLVHADDELHPNYAATMLAAAQRHPDAAALFCNAQIIDAHSRPKFSFPDYVKSWIRPKQSGDLVVQGDTGLASLLKGNYIMCPTVCYRRVAIGALRFDANWRMVLDLNFFARLLLNGGHLVGIPDSVYFYRRHSQNQTVKLTAEHVRFSEEVALYHDLSNLAASRGWNQTAATGQAKTIIKLHLAYSAVTNLLRFKLRAALSDTVFLQGLCPCTPVKNLPKGS